MQLHRRIALLLFGSGVSALLYQTAWQRSFRLVFGATTAASAAVLGVFMAGLGLGSWWLGQRAERERAPLAFYARLEFGICCVAASSPLTTDWLGRVYLWLGGEPRMGIGGATLLRLLVALLVMGPAALLMGGTLPAAARAAETDDDGTRRNTALLYASNTVGAVAGSVIGTFALFELFGTRLALWLGCLINLLVAVVARAWARRVPEVPTVNSDASATTAASCASSRWERYAIYLAATLVGFVFIGSELVWYRVMSPLLGGTTYSFGLILAVALSGIGLGSWAFSSLSKRAATWSMLGLTAIMEAFALAAPLWIGDGLAIFGAHVRGLAALGFAPLLLAYAMVCAVVVLPASLVAGYQFPLLIAMLGRGRQQVAIHVGRAYLWNTAGSVAGSLLVGFVLIPHWGALRTWRGLAASLLVIAGAAAFWAARRRERIHLATPLLGISLVTCCIGALAAEGPTAVWRHSPIGAGRVSLGGIDANGLRQWVNAQRNAVVWERDGVDVSVALAATASASFVVNGKIDGSVHEDRGTQAMSGLMAALLHPNPKQGFVLGLGTGMSAGWLAKALEHVDVAELEPAIVAIARAVSAANGDVLHANNVNLFLGDGREYLLTTRKNYDVVVSEPSNPYRAGVASLFTADFYRIVRQRLAHGGIFVQWQQGYEVDASVVLLTLRSLKEVFPFVEIWQAQESDIAFLASTEPRTYDVGLIRERAKREPYLGAMRRTWLVEGAEGLLSHAYGSSAFVERLIAVNHPQVNTDDENLLEFSVARSVGNLSSSAASELFSTALALGADEFKLQNGELDRGLVRALRHRSFIVSGASMPSEFARLRDARAALFESGCIGDGRMPLASGSEPPAPRDLVDAYALGRVFALSGSASVAPIIERLEAEGYDEEASFLRALQAQSAGRFGQALDHLERAIVGLRRNALPLCELARQAVELATDLALRVPGAADRIARALHAQPFAGYLAQTARVAAAQRLAFASRDPKLCVDALGAELRRPTWNLGFLSARLECLQLARHPLARVAEDDLVDYLGNAAGGYGIAVTSQSAERP